MIPSNFGRESKVLNYAAKSSKARFVFAKLGEMVLKIARIRTGAGIMSWCLKKMLIGASGFCINKMDDGLDQKYSMCTY